MMYPYMVLADETEVVHSQIIEDSGKQKIIVNFERATEDGFDSARCELPDYHWIEKNGYSDDEIKLFEQLLQSNAHLIYKYAANGGIQIAQYINGQRLKVFFWSNENGEPIHVHIAKGKPTPNATKVWLTKSGGCILANNGSNIPQKELNDLMEFISAQFFLICSEWKKFFLVDEIHFYCQNHGESVNE